MVVSVVAVRPSALVSKLAMDVRVNKQTFLSVCTLGEELAFISWVHILALSLRLVTFGPVLAAHLDLVLLSLLCSIATLTVVQICNNWSDWLYWTKPLQSFPFQLFSFCTSQLRFNELPLLSGLIVAALIVLLVIVATLVKSMRWLHKLVHLVLVVKSLSHVTPVLLLLVPLILVIEAFLVYSIGATVLVARLIRGKVVERRVVSFVLTEWSHSTNKAQYVCVSG